MFRVRWTAWRGLGNAEQKHVLHRATTIFGAMEDNHEGPTALFSLLGHKGDLMLVHFRRTLDELNHAELTVAGSELNEYLEPITSYLSVIELGLYEASVKLYSRSEEHTSELQSRRDLVCRLLLEKKKKKTIFILTAT